MNDKVARVQAGGLLGYQAVPQLLPAYNKFMGGVDRAGQLRKTYGFDRKGTTQTLMHGYASSFSSSITPSTMPTCSTKAAASSMA